MMDNFSQHTEYVTICTECNHNIPISFCMPPPAQEDHRLRHGLVLSEVNMKLIGSAVEETDRCLREVRRKLRTLKQTVKALEAAESTLQHTLVTQRTYIAPVRRLPVELLAAIFEWACYDSPIGVFDCAALDISLVCKFWRDVMHGNPAIWSGLRLPASYELEWRRNSKHWLRRIQLCLLATCGLPLAQPLRMSTQAAQTNVRFLSVIRNFSNQWQSLQIIGGDVTSPSLSGCSFLRLHTLEIDTQALISGINPDHFASAPLRTVTLYNAMYSNVVPRLPWSRLDELRTKCSYIYALRVLAECTNLVHWYHDDSFALDDEGAPTHVTLAYLQALHIRSVDVGSESGNSRTLDYITAPMLETLCLSWDSAPTDYVQPYVSAFLARSYCRLQTLVMEQSPASERPDLSSLMALRCLSVEYPRNAPLTDADIAMLGIVGDNHEPAILPRLEELSVGGFGHYRGQAVVDMVASRRLAGRPLRALDLDLFSVDMEHFGSLTALDRLRDLVPEFVGSE